jgi:hypothetical protein
MYSYGANSYYPREGLVEVERDRLGIYLYIVTYDRELSENEVRGFRLDYIGDKMEYYQRRY